MLATVNILLTFLYQWYAVVRFGVGLQADALFASMTLPVIILSVITDSLSSVLVPVLTGLERQRVARVTWTLLQGIETLFLLLAVALALGAPWWIPLTLPGLDIAARQMAIELVRIHLVGMVFGAANSVLSAMYFAQRRFVRVEISMIVSNTVALALMPWLVSAHGIAGVAIALTLRTALQTVMLLSGAGRYHRPVWKDPAVVEAWRRVGPLLLGSAYYKTDLLLDRFLASHAASGGITLLHLGQQLYGAGNIVLTRSIASPMMPPLTEAADANRWPDFARLARNRLISVIAITVAAAVVVTLAGQPLLGMIFEYRSFSEAQTRDLWIMMLALTGVLIGGGAGQILASAFYSAHDVRTPTKIGMLGFTVGILMKIAGFVFGGLIGLAIGTSIYFMLNAVWLTIALRRTLSTKSRAMERAP
jgi:putative peptidoglycan lipid II flippase